MALSPASGYRPTTGGKTPRTHSSLRPPSDTGKGARYAWRQRPQASLPDLLCDCRQVPAVVWAPSSLASDPTSHPSWGVIISASPPTPSHNAGHSSDCHCLPSSGLGGFVGVSYPPLIPRTYERASRVGHPGPGISGHVLCP